MVKTAEETFFLTFFFETTADLTTSLLFFPFSFTKYTRNGNTNHSDAESRELPNNNNNNDNNNKKNPERRSLFSKNNKSDKEETEEDHKTTKWRFLLQLFLLPTLIQRSQGWFQFVCCPESRKHRHSTWNSERHQYFKAGNSWCMNLPFIWNKIPKSVPFSNSPQEGNKKKIQNPFGISRNFWQNDCVSTWTKNHCKRFSKPHQENAPRNDQGCREKKKQKTKTRKQQQQQLVKMEKTLLFFLRICCSN